VNKYKALVGCFFVCCVVLCCGCIEEQRQSVDVEDGEVDTSMFIGAWAGSMEFSMFAWGEDTGTSTVTALEFTEDTLYMTITTDNTTQEMENSYRIEGDQLMVSPIFTGDMPFNRSQFNGSQRPPFDGNESERPPFDFNGTEQPPFDGERPTDGERPFNGEYPTDGEHLSNRNSYTYRFSADNKIMYLNGSPFTKET
jgi:hypothetical protein